MIRSRFTYTHTLYASYLGYVCQAIVNNLAPLLFLTLQRTYGISLGQITLLVTVNFITQLFTDLLSAKYVDRMGYRVSVVAAHVLCCVGLVGVGLLPRLLIAFFNTDEIFALAMSRTEPLTLPYMLGLGTLPILGWTGGTLCGGLAGSVLPVSIRGALGVMLYGMFVAIVVPPARQEKPVLAVVTLAVVLSCLFSWTPGLKDVSAGISIVICTVAAAAVCAVLFPVADEEAAQ